MLQLQHPIWEQPDLVGQMSNCCLAEVMQGLLRTSESSTAALDPLSSSFSRGLHRPKPAGHHPESHSCAGDGSGDYSSGSQDGQGLNIQGNGMCAHAQQQDQDESCSFQGRSSQICYDYTKGLCTRGDKCKYSHDLATIVSFNSKEKGICFDYLRNQCHRGLLCRFSHDLSNIAQQCQPEEQKVASASPPSAAPAPQPAPASPAALLTPFSADDPAPVRQGQSQEAVAPAAPSTSLPPSGLAAAAAAAAAAAKTASKTTAICYDFVKGVCLRGGDCRYSHDLSLIARTARGGQVLQKPQAEICYDFLRGRCNRGSTCKYSHNVSAANSQSGFGQGPCMQEGLHGQHSGGGGMGMAGFMQSHPSLPMGMGGYQDSPHGQYNRLSSSMSAGPLAMGLCGSGMQLTTSLSASISPDLEGRTLAGSLATELPDLPHQSHPGYHQQQQQHQYNQQQQHSMGDQQAPMWQARAAAAAQAQAMAMVQQRHFAAAAMSSYVQHNHMAQQQLMAQAAAAAGGVPQGMPIEAKAMAAAIQQQQHQQAMMGAHGFGGQAAEQSMQAWWQQQQHSMSHHNLGNAAMRRTDPSIDEECMPQSIQSMLARSASTPLVSGMPGHTPVSAELSALLSNLGDNPQLLADTLSELAAAAQANVRTGSTSGQSQPQPISGRHYEPLSPRGSKNLDANFSRLTASGSLPSGVMSHPDPTLVHTLNAAHANLQAQLSPDLLPLLKEIWASGPKA